MGFSLSKDAVKQLNPEDKDLLKEERIRFNTKTCRIVNVLFAAISPAFILQNIFSPKTGIADQFTPYYILIFFLLTITNLLFYIFFRIKGARNTVNNRHIFLFLLILYTESMALSYLDLHYGQELALYIFSLMSISTFLWLSQKHYLILSSYVLLLLLATYMKLYLYNHLPFSYFLPGIVYYIIFLALHKNITSVRRQNFLHMTKMQEALDEVKTLQGILPICSHCKRIRDDKGYWNQVETYMSRYSDLQFSHGLCPDCISELYPDIELTESDNSSKGKP
ncbi:MAG: hypothetical protein PQJ59_11715 [Spirochaetales bacterium]|nr:hypothetical protein [Spirochaetales bacterium]